ncbi:sugar phosphate nucleotidyltransferase [Neomoorella carbonis]|uniref:sugar phosphate nucleotidyltransferase n=1 Tax=Neomoorella carbonis TaxID=3062783 RepID=UPI0032518CF4
MDTMKQLVKEMKDVFTIIMAGGSGERFWPYSRKDRPKQFLQVVGQGTLLQQTVQRAKLLCPVEQIYIVTGRSYLNLVQEQVPEIPKENLIVEPVGRDTAPCIALALSILEARGLNGTMIVLPSDQMVIGEDGFLRSLSTAVKLAHETCGLVTIGIRPTRPETGYGYIRIGERLSSLSAFRVAAFTEKPDMGRAISFLSSGEYLWNSGMFIWQVSAIHDAFERYLPELIKGITPIRESVDTPDFETILSRVFPTLTRISIDYGIMEKADNVYVVPGDFGWDDLGTWTALERVTKCDIDGNFVQGRSVLVDTKNTILRNDNTDKLVVTFGLKDTLVVDTPDVLMVADKKRAPELKKLLDELRKQGLERYLMGLTTPGFDGNSNENSVETLEETLSSEYPVYKKPWGREILWAVNERYAAKVIHVYRGHSLSKQYHQEKRETMLFIKGRGKLELGEEVLDVSPPMVVDIPAGMVHRIQAISDVIFIEVSSPELDDVVRLADDYGRMLNIK